MQKSKRRPSIDKTILPFPVRKKVPEKREGDSEAHLKYMRGQLCIVCQRRGEPHHLLHVHEEIGGSRGMALRNPDMFCIPLCRVHHNEIHESIPLTATPKECWFWELHQLSDDPVTCALKFATYSPDEDIKSLARERLNKWKSL